MEATMNKLEIHGLSIEYRVGDDWIRAVEDVSFDLGDEEVVGIVGESGSGKSTIAKSIQGILPDNGRVSDGEIRLGENDITDLSEKERNEYRWKDISYIAQSAMNALNPVYPVKRQFWEIYRIHTDLSKNESLERTRELLVDVGLDPSYANSYPHELSGGERQRVVVALALALDPDIIIADEPTTGLDVVVQDEILNLISEIQERTGVSMILITHDINVVAEVADRVVVLYGGKVMEKGSTREVFKESTHPYTIALYNSFPTIGKRNDNLISIPGVPPDPRSLPTGCRFTERCPFATQECHEEPPLVRVSEGHSARCHYTEKASEFRERATDPAIWEPIGERTKQTELPEEPLSEADD